MEPLDPTLLDRADLRAALAARDISTVYRLLSKAGLTQRQIAELTSQSQSEVSEIVTGRQVRDVEVLERIANGLGIPRAWIGLSYGEQQPTKEEATEDEDMKRRALITTTTIAALGHVIQGLDQITEPALPTDQPLPQRLTMAHVHTVRTITDQLRSIARYYGGQANLFTTAAKLYTRWMQVPATETITAQLAAALAELHTEAGWCCYDSGLDATGHFTRALRLADTAKDAYSIANAAWHAGATLIRTGHPNDALKLFQLGQIQLSGFTPGKPIPATLRTDDPRLPTLTARLNLNSATAYALMNRPEQAQHCLTQAHDGWDPQDPFERAAGDLMTAGIHLDLGHLDTAAHFATSAVRTYSEGHRRSRILAELFLAEVHIRAGEPHGLILARHAIQEVSTLQSIAARQRLMPLAAALQARPSSDTQQLAQMARKTAATRI